MEKGKEKKERTEDQVREAAGRAYGESGDEGKERRKLSKDEAMDFVFEHYDDVLRKLAE